MQPHIFHPSLLHVYLNLQIFLCSLPFYFLLLLLFYLLHQPFPLCSLFCSPPPPRHSATRKNCPRADNITDTRTPLSSCFCSRSLPSSPPLTRDVKQRSASCQRIHHCQAKYSLDDWQDRCRIHPQNTLKQPECFSQVLPHWLIPFAPHKSLTQISKENVRLFCSSSVICHTKRLSFTSGDVSCRLCHTDRPLLSTQLSPVQFIPLLSSLFTHTFCYFPISAASCTGAPLTPRTQTRVLVISTWILRSASVHQILPQFLLSDKKRFLRKESLYQEVCWCVACQEYTQSYQCQPVRYRWD